MDTYLPLIRLRQRIVGARDALSKTIIESSNFAHGYKKILSHNSSGCDSIPLTQKLEQVQFDLSKLDKELNDEIHLVIGAVAVQDSSANRTQTERATLLTLLAAVYLPLTLVSGIFGMNITQIGDTTFRDCLATLGVIAVCNISFVVAYVYWRRWRRECERREMEEQQLKEV